MLKPSDCIPLERAEEGSVRICVKLVRTEPGVSCRCRQSANPSTPSFPNRYEEVRLSSDLST